MLINWRCLMMDNHMTFFVRDKGSTWVNTSLAATVYPLGWFLLVPFLVVAMSSKVDNHPSSSSQGLRSGRCCTSYSSVLSPLWKRRRSKATSPRAWGIYRWSHVEDPQVPQRAKDEGTKGRRDEGRKGCYGSAHKSSAKTCTSTFQKSW